MNKMNALTEQRVAKRLLSAKEDANRIVEEAQQRGIDISIVGSLAAGTFKSHSDIDLLVHGDAAPHRRAMVERLVACRLRGRDIPYDLIFEADLTEERLKEMLHAIV